MRRASHSQQEKENTYLVMPDPDFLEKKGVSITLEIDSDIV